MPSPPPPSPSPEPPPPTLITTQVQTKHHNQNSAKLRPSKPHTPKSRHSTATVRGLRMTSRSTSCPRPSGGSTPPSSAPSSLSSPISSPVRRPRLSFKGWITVLDLRLAAEPNHYPCSCRNHASPIVLQWLLDGGGAIFPGLLSVASFSTTTSPGWVRIKKAHRLCGILLDPTLERLGSKRRSVKERPCG